MTEEEYNYQVGAFNAYNGVSQVIERAIKKNGGATTAFQIINVFNEISAHVQYKRQELRDSIEDDKQEALLEAIQSINAGLNEKLGNVYIFKGGN